MGLIVAVVQNKGGVGKTTLATSLFAHAVYAKYSAGILDLDPQGNTSTWAVGPEVWRGVRQHHGAEAFTLPGGVVAEGLFSRNTAPVSGEVFRLNTGDEIPPGNVFPCSSVPGGFVVPANPYLATHGMHSVTFDRLGFGVLFVDTPTNMPPRLFRAVVAAAHVVVSPVQPTVFSMQGVGRMVHEIETACGGLQAENVLRLVVNMRQRNTMHEACEMAIREQWGSMVANTVVPLATTWQQFNSGKYKWTGRCTVAKTAAALWDELVPMMERRAAA